MRSRPIGDGLEEHELVSPEFINAGSTWNFLLRVQVLEVAVTEPECKLNAETVEEDVVCVLVLANESSRLRVTDVLHLTPPFPQTDAANGADSPRQGDHGCVES